MRNSSVFLASLLISTQLLAAIPRSETINLEKVLSLKSENKFSELKKMGPKVYSRLRDITFDQDKRLGLRWQAFMALVRIGEKESLPEINKALKSQDWFLRDAAIRVLPAIDKKTAYDAAFNGLNDSAMVVRSSAALVLGQLNKPEASERLWRELYSKNNYIRHQSLWIRKHIMHSLAEIAPQTHAEKFIKALDDSDSTLYEPAIRGLERITGQKLGDAKIPPVYKRYLWKKWYQEKSQPKSKT